MRLKMDLTRIYLDRVIERLIMWIVWRTPKVVIMWATIRLHANATYVYPNRTPDQISIWDALEAWNTGRRRS